jgi:hypothetical protein
MNIFVASPQFLARLRLRQVALSGKPEHGMAGMYVSVPRSASHHHSNLALQRFEGASKNLCIHALAIHNFE